MTIMPVVSGNFQWDDWRIWLLAPMTHYKGFVSWYPNKAYSLIFTSVIIRVWLGKKLIGICKIKL